MPLIDVTRTYLELTRPDQLVPAGAPRPGLRIERRVDFTPAEYRRLYRGVGEAYQWRDRSDWSDEQIIAHLKRDEISVWVLCDGDAVAGWFELQAHPGGAVEIVYFGLMPEYHRQGLGKYLLTECVGRAWALRPHRVWLHTCTLDDAAALPNYIARGFRPFHTETYQAQTG